MKLRPLLFGVALLIGLLLAVIGLLLEKLSGCHDKNWQAEFDKEQLLLDNARLRKAVEEQSVQIRFLKGRQ